MKSKKKKIFSNKKFSNTKDRNKLFYDKILEYDIVDKKKYNIAYTFMKNSKFDFKLTSNLYNKIKRIKINKFKPYKIEKKKIKEEDYNYLFEKIPNLIYNSIITNLKNRIIFSKGNRLINIYYDKNIDFQMIRKIDIILNMFDSILQNEKYYSIDLFLSPLKKKIYKNKSIEKVNINTGSIKYKRNYITIYREEEWDKVLIHELIHYKHLHILSIRDKLKYAFKDINFKGSILNPNEAYVESMAIILYCLYNYHLKQKYIKVPLKKYIEIRISIEMGWSLGQFIKILHHKKYKSYQELFDKEYYQNTAILSYYLLKLYFLYNTRFQKCILFSTRHEFKCFKDIDIKNIFFSEIIENGFKFINLINKDESLCMTCLE